MASKKGFFVALGIVVLCGAAVLVWRKGLAEQEEPMDPNLFPAFVFVNFHCTNNSSEPVSFSVDEPKKSKSGQAKKYKGQTIHTPLSKAGPLLANAGKSVDIGTDGSWGSTHSSASFTVRVRNSQKELASGVKTITSEQIIQKDGNGSNVTWDGKALTITKGVGYRPASSGG